MNKVKHLSLINIYILGALLIPSCILAKEYSITIQDALDKTFTFKDRIKRIVPVVYEIPTYVYAIEGKKGIKTIVNMSADGNRYTDKGRWYAELLPELRGLRLGAGKELTPNVEQILKDNPEIVITHAHFDAKDEDRVGPLERVGLKVLTIPCCSGENVFESYMLVSYLFGKIDRAQMLVKNYERENSALKKIFANTKEKDAIKILEVENLDKNIRVVANGYIDYSSLGMNNPAKKQTGAWSFNIDIEQMMLWNPDVIFIPVYARSVSPKDFYENKLFADIKAVKNKRIYKLPLLTESMGAPESYLIPTWLATMAHGENKVKFDKPLKMRVKDVYKNIYDKDLSKEQINKVLQMEHNKDSNNYVKIFK